MNFSFLNLFREKLFNMKNLKIKKVNSLMKVNDLLNESNVFLAAKLKK